MRNVFGSWPRNTCGRSYWRADLTMMNCITLLAILIQEESNISQFGEKKGMDSKDIRKENDTRDRNLSRTGSFVAT